MNQSRKRDTVDPTTADYMEGADALANYLDDLPLDPRSTGYPEGFEDYRNWETKVLARMYHSSMQPDADASPSLRHLALRYATDPRKDLRFDHNLYAAIRLDKEWNIHQHEATYEARLSPASGKLICKVRCAFRIKILDVTLSPERQLSTLRRLIVQYLCVCPEEPDDLPDPFDISAAPSITSLQAEVLQLFVDSGKIPPARKSSSS